ncbi:MAG TPA: dihydrodipicolinate synthase family protein [Armatimonadota bacterium]|jgi:2-keto-3-deoxy-L-arabinonate dehydratase|nr:dihydrodipicolinate synthase family protein [Armatimonadota bacterium]HPT96240.1 dihydrodipicolinate synthase family protein [Armatimonadota bacterium]
MLPIDGMVPVLITPFGEDEAVRVEDTERQVEVAVRSGVSAICLPAYGGESHKLAEAERMDLIRTAVNSARGRIPVIAHCSHASVRLAGELARRSADLGVEAIAVALPRSLSLTEDDHIRYCARAGKATNLPLLVLDYNPGGPTVGLSFVRRLLAECPTFGFLVIEEPLMAAKVGAIRDATGGQVGVLEGWGGTHLMELAAAGICGVMPGLGTADLMERIWRLRRAGSVTEAYSLFTGVLPLLLFCQQNPEIRHYAERRLLLRRGVITSETIREPTVALDRHSQAYGDEVIALFLRTLERAGLPRRPLE